MKNSVLLSKLNVIPLPTNCLRNSVLDFPSSESDLLCCSSGVRSEGVRMKGNLGSSLIRKRKRESESAIRVETFKRRVCFVL